MEHSNELQYQGKLEQYNIVVEQQLQNLRKFTFTSYRGKIVFLSFAFVTTFFIGKRPVSLMSNCSFEKFSLLANVTMHFTSHWSV